MGLSYERRLQKLFMMDSGNTRRITKIKSPNYIVSPISVNSPLLRYLRDGSPSPVGSPDRYSPPSARSSYLRSTSSGTSGSYSGSFRKSLSPLSAVENVKMEDDGLVMDEVLFLSPESVSSSAFKLSKSNKTELCRSWEDFDYCRLASNCQYAHGKEELRPSLFTTKNRAEGNTCSNKSCTTRSAPYIPKFRIIPPVTKKAAVAVSRAASPTVSEHTSISPTITIKPEQFSINSVTPTTTSECFGSTSVPTKAKHSDKSLIANIKPDDSWLCVSPSSSVDYWSPQDDGIQVVVTSQTDKCQSREDIDAYIHSVLYGPTTRKRWPVFDEFSPDESTHFQ